MHLIIAILCFILGVADMVILDSISGYVLGGCMIVLSAVYFCEYIFN